MTTKRAGEPLDGVAAGLAAPFAGGEVALDVLARQALEAHPRLDQPLADLAAWRDQAERRIDAVRAAGEQAQAGGRLVDQFGLRQDAPADADHRVGGQDQRAGELRLALRARRPPPRPSRGPAAWQDCAEARPSSASRRGRPAAAGPARRRSARAAAAGAASRRRAPVSDVRP